VGTSEDGRRLGDRTRGSPLDFPNGWTPRHRGPTSSSCSGGWSSRTAPRSDFCDSPESESIALMCSRPPIPCEDAMSLCHVKQMSYDAEAQWNGLASPLILEM